MRATRLLCLPLLLLAAVATAQAATVVRVDIRGLDEPMAQNARLALPLVDAIGKDLSGRRLALLLREAPAQVRSALEPFGYYSAQVDVQRLAVAGQPRQAAIRIDVDPGTPVRVRGERISISGDGGDDTSLQRGVAAFRPAIGDVFDQGVYEAGKARIAGQLADRGYFDAALAEHRVEVTRAEHAADIALAWRSGTRYALGPVDFEQAPQAIIHERVLDKLVDWTPGDPYQQDSIDRLRQSLMALDYFSRIDIEPDPANAVDHQVPVQVRLAPAKRSIYIAGVSYGTDSGPGVRLGVERRYLNARGHKAQAELDYAQRRRTLTLQYRIPAFAWLDGWYTASLQAADEQTDYIDTRRVEFVASRSGEVNMHLTANVSLHVLRERWAYPAQGLAPAWQYGTFTFPALRAEYIDVDDRLYPRRGMSSSLELRGGAKGAGSDADFAQVHARASWFKGLGADNRLILRGELGHTFTDAVVDLPPSLRFYAGGDRSIRGYDYREVGPRLGTFGLGANNLITASSEFEHYFSEQWGGAVFVDTGSAFNGRTPDWRTGVGIGLRWRSPVGPLRVDLAHGLDHPDANFTLSLNFGADL
jgi:translocation and assembly module TamA